MTERQITLHLKRTRLKFPILAVLGPKQSGKTTLILDEFSQSEPTYIDLKSDSTELLKQCKKMPIIIDNAHCAPKLLKTLPDLVGGFKHNFKKQIILIGLPHTAFKKEILKLKKDNLVGIVNLMPLTIAESMEKRRDQCVYSGFMPAVCFGKKTPALFYGKYYHDYLESEAWRFIKSANRKGFVKFVALLAERVGQTVNLNSLSKKIGVSSATLLSWLNLLENSCMIFRVPCSTNNFGKRLIKSPKIYFTDIGLASYLLGIENPKQVAGHKLLDSLFENMVVAEILKNIYNAGEEPELYHFTDNHGVKIDLILVGKKTHLIEINPSAVYDSSFAGDIRKISGKIKLDKCMTVIYAGEKIGSSVRNFADGLMF